MFMDHLTSMYDPLTEYAQIAELLRLRVLFGLDAQRNAFTETGAWKRGLAIHDEYPDDDVEDMRSMLRRRYSVVELNQAVQVNPDTPFGHNLALLKEQLALDEVECCIFTAFAFADQDSFIISLLKDYLPTTRWTTFRKLWAIFCGLNATQVEACLGPNGSLINLTLFTVDRDSDLSIERMLGCFSGLASATFHKDREYVASLGDHFRRVSIDNLLQRNQFKHMSGDLDTLIPYLRSALQDKTAGSNVLLYGPAGGGKTELARVIAHEVEANLYEIKSESGLGAAVKQSERMRKLRFSQRLLSRSKNAVLLFDSADDSLACASYNDNALTALLEINIVPIIWVANSIKGVNPSILHRFDIVLHLDSLPAEYMQQMLKSALGESNSNTELDMLVAQPEVTPAMIQRMHRVSSMNQKGGSTISPQMVAKSCIKSHVEAAGGRIDTSRGERMSSLAYDVHSSTASCDLAELAESLVHAGGGRICLYGPPGTGKTAYAKHIAHHLGKTLKVAPASAILSRYIGDSEKSIARIFAHAAAQDTVLFFDEVDSLLASRTDATRSWEISQVNELLCQMEQFNGVMIAATNQFDILDTAVMRRFDLKIKFDWLRPEQAEQLLISSMNSLKTDVTRCGIERIRKLKQLAPGDFALVLRQARFQTIRSCDVFVEKIEAENRIKNARSRSIGFV